LAVVEPVRKSRTMSTSEILKEETALLGKRDEPAFRRRVEGDEIGYATKRASASRVCDARQLATGRLSMPDSGIF